MLDILLQLANNETPCIKVHNDLPYVLENCQVYSKSATLYGNKGNLTVVKSRYTEDRIFVHYSDKNNVYFRYMQIDGEWIPAVLSDGKGYGLPDLDPPDYPCYWSLYTVRDKGVGYYTCVE